MATVAAAADVDEELSPRQKSSNMEQAIDSLGSMNNGIDSLDLRADPDAQATVTDFLDFTEYLPSDMMRSLTLVGKLDQTYVHASTKVHNLTTAWGQLPNMQPDERPAPAQLRAEISENLNFAVSSRVYSHAEAVRMAENVGRHYKRLKKIHAKLQAMLENYPTAEEQKSPMANTKSSQLSRGTKITLRLPGGGGGGGSGGGEKARRPRVPRITVPGEVLAPYEVGYETYSDDSESSEEEEEDDDDLSRRTPAPRVGQQQRIKLVKNPKTPKQKLPKGPGFPTPLSTSAALSALKPPPENALPGSEDAPWMQLTLWELAKLRKRMKKNSAWTPSETMIARELKNLGRGWDAYNAAKKKAEEEGRPFEHNLPAGDGASGTEHPPEGAVSVDAAIAAEDAQLLNRGMELNRAKKLKREQLAKLAAEEAEESARKMADLAKNLFFKQQGSATTPSQPQVATRASASSKSKQKKRKRDSVAETEAEKPELAEGSAQRPQLKRMKTETPVPIPQYTPGPSSHHLHETPVPHPQLTPGSTTAVPHSTTPVPVPIPGGHDQSIVAVSKPSSSPTNASASSANTVTTTVPIKPPADGGLPAPPLSPKKSTTPILPPVRETRQRDAKKEQPKENSNGQLTVKQSTSRAATPAATTPAPESRRPASRGKAMSQEPQPSLAVDRPRRASTARNTPAPEPRQPSKRTKRPAPGVISRTNSGGNSAVGRRKAAPKKKRGATKRDKGQGQAVEVEVEVEVDDDGNVIDADEPRYCICNRVSFGTMIQCDNVDNCKQEWFHLECVGLLDIPARTTKWFCPDCRVLLNIGEKGEISARGVKM